MLVDLHLGSALLAPALDTVRGMEVTVHHLDCREDASAHNTVWARGGDVDRFEAGLEDDPGVVSWRSLSESRGWHLYRVRHPPGTDEAALCLAAFDLGGVLERAASRGEGWEFTLFFPEREAFAEFHDRCADHDLPVEVRSITEGSVTPPGECVALTDSQREALRLAAAEGYFSIPRETSLAELAEQLGVSGQATSERLRRGLEALVRDSLSVPDGSK